MRFIPDAVSRKVAKQVLLAQKNSPTILLGVGVVSMVGSTIMACRATLKLEEVLDEVEENKFKASEAKALVDSGQAADGITYSDREMKRDLQIIAVRGLGSVVKLYAPSIILGGVGIVCLTKSHNILRDRNMALTAAYVAVDKAFQTYRERVIDRFGEETDRELRYDLEEVDVVNEDTGKITSQYRVAEGDHGLYSRWFDSENKNWSPNPHENYNWVYLRNQQNWANDMLRARGHVFLNEVYGMLGLTHTTAGAVVGWVYERDNPNGDNFIDFGCWDQQHEPLEAMNGRDGSILLDFNVDGPIYQLLDERNKKT